MFFVDMQSNELSEIKGWVDSVLDKSRADDIMNCLDWRGIIFHVFCSC